ncbi:MULTISPECIES: HesA/MoeB/ThiF family protein [unclassified Sphingomonas]|uniref:HesA/MoeB/ThiF family protein n=1 Tax=unclassified Sphingomonas TaxID=196159 RepID=UPI00082BB71B|nr:MULTISPECIES: molybdopterin-synthase adenylyltransferase MoeB [unclassified Sphingomonas]
MAAPSPGPELADDELDRYARHLILREIGGIGQRRIRGATVLVVGVGGIGTPAIQYLAAAGIGRLRIVDDDRVDLSNLQRQILFGDAAVGARKVDAAAAAIARLNPGVAVDAHAIRADAATLPALLDGVDAVVDGSDNFATRLAVADAAHAARVPLVSAAIGGFEGQVALYRGWETGRPCYRCVVGDDPGRAETSCADQGVLGATAGVVGTLAAVEALRAIHPFGEDSVGKLLLVDLLGWRFRTLSVPADPACPTCAG